MFDKIIEMLKRKNIFDYKESLGELTFVIKNRKFRITCYRGVKGYRTNNIKASNDYDSIEYSFFKSDIWAMSCNINELDLFIENVGKNIDLWIENPLEQLIR